MDATEPLAPLTSLTVRGFRCFADLTVAPLARVNVIVGRNNAGKTCLLEAQRGVLTTPPGRCRRRRRHPRRSAPMPGPRSMTGRARDLLPERATEVATAGRICSFSRPSSQPMPRRPQPLRSPQLVIDHPRRSWSITLESTSRSRSLHPSWSPPARMRSPRTDYGPGPGGADAMPPLAEVSCSPWRAGFEPMRQREGPTELDGFEVSLRRAEGADATQR